MSFQLIGKANRIAEDPDQLFGDLDKRKLKGLEGDIVKVAICPPEKLPVSIRNLDESGSDSSDFLIVVLSNKNRMVPKRGRALGKGDSVGRI